MSAVSSKNWWTLHWLNVGALRLYVLVRLWTMLTSPRPYHFEGDKMNFNVTQIHSWSTPVRSGARLRSITLPSTRDSWNRVHIFAVSVTPSLLSPVPDADKPLLLDALYIPSCIFVDCSTLARYM